MAKSGYSFSIFSKVINDKATGPEGPVVGGIYYD